MTYKNTKFEDSAVMRSLERVAIAKGMVKPETLKKEAAAELEESPQTLSEKILKLCEGLRDQGMEKYANEIEVKFLTYKKAANSLYDVTKEKGEDLVDFAHPDGGKKLDKNWDELGSIETITEKHEKILEVVNKMPQGKLASKNIINAVKIVLADADDDPFLVYGKTPNTKTVLGQDKDTSSPLGTAVNVGAGAAVTAGTMVGIYKVISWLKSLFPAKIPALEEELTRLAIKMGYKSAKQLPANVAKKVVDNFVKREIAAEDANAARLALEALNKTVSATPEALKNVAPQAVKNIVPRTFDAIKNLGPKALDAVKNLGPQALKLIKTPIGGGLAADIAAGASAVLIGAISGYYAGTALMDSLYAVADIQGAGERLIAECKDIAKELDINEQKHIDTFAEILPLLVVAYEKLKSSNATVQDAAIVHDLVNAAREQANFIWMIASNHQSQPGLGKAINQFVTMFGGAADVLATANNFIKVMDKTSSIIKDFMDRNKDQIAQLAAKQPKTEVHEQIVASLEDVIKLYENLNKTIDSYKIMIEYNKSIDADKKKKFQDWLSSGTPGSLKDYVVQLITELSEKAPQLTTDNQKETLAKVFKEKADEIQNILNTFNTKYLQNKG